MQSRWGTGRQPGLGRGLEIFGNRHKETVHSLDVYGKKNDDLMNFNINIIDLFTFANIETLKK